MPHENAAQNMMICVVGPTASGKSELAIKIAKKIKGEIISADSRQIYKGMDIGSGKVEGKWKKLNSKKVFVYKDVPHYLIDEASPRLQYSVAKFQTNAKKIIADIVARGKVPIICGGTGHWVDAIAMQQILPVVPPDLKLRRQFGKLTTEQMFSMLKRLDPDRAKTIDEKNPRRLIRAIEIVQSTGQPVPKLTNTESNFNIVWIGIKPEQITLETKIKKRLKDRIKSGMLNEVQTLHNQGLSWKKLEAFGLEYKYIALHLQGKLSKDEMDAQLFIAIRQYAKRQMTWWKRNKNIRWYADASKVSLKSF